MQLLKLLISWYEPDGDSQGPCSAKGVPMRCWSKIQWIDRVATFHNFDLHINHINIQWEHPNNQYIYIDRCSQHVPNKKKHTSDFPDVQICPDKRDLQLEVVKPPRIRPEFHAEKFHGETSAASASGEALDAQGTEISEMACDRQNKGSSRSVQCFLNFCCTMSYLFLDSTNREEWSFNVWNDKVLTAQLGYSTQQSFSTRRQIWHSEGFPGMLWYSSQWLALSRFLGTSTLDQFGCFLYPCLS